MLLQIIQMAQMQQMQAAQMGRPVSEQQMNQIIMTQVKDGLQQTTDKVIAHMHICDDDTAGCGVLRK